MSEKRILVVESEKPVAQAITEALARFDVKVAVVDDGKKVLAAAKSPLASLIILRVELPGQSGYSICMKLRKEKELKDIPLILTSSEANEDTFESHRKLKVRADEYMILRSPFPADELASKVTSLVPLAEVASAEEAEIITLDEEEAVTLDDDEAFSTDELVDLGAVDGGTGDSTVVMETPTTDGADEELPSLDDVLDNLDIGSDSSPPAAERVVSESPPEGTDLTSLDDVLESLDDAAEAEVERPASAASDDLDMSLLDDLDVKGRDGAPGPAEAAAAPAEGPPEEDLLAGLDMDEPAADKDGAEAGGAAEADLDLDAIVKAAEDAAPEAGAGAEVAPP
ncbi:MAG TPA: response regulator [Myxococcota bacterium]|nr:response regulator [Myxococcota bacterium]